MASDLPRFCKQHGLSLHMQCQFDMIHGISRNRLDDTLACIKTGGNPVWFYGVLFLFDYTG